MAKKEEEKIATPEEMLETFLNETEDDHFNFEPDYGEHCVVSSGSLLLDVAMGGGLRPSILRNVGVTEGGKTSNALAFKANFLKEPKKRRGLYVKAEGRLSREVQERSGIKFVTDAKDWKDGTCFIFKCNIYETVINLINKLINNNEEKYKYFIIIDAMDSLLAKGDKDKTPEQANKVAATAALSTDFLRRMSLVLSSRGHFCILISQIRSAVKIDPYAKTDPRVTNASGGNALLHYSDWIIEFQQRWIDDAIWEKDKESDKEGKSDKSKGKRLGHYCKVIFRKSPNENTGTEIKYPVKYGRSGGNSVWVEYEVFDYLQMMDWITVAKQSGWITPEKELIGNLKAWGFEAPGKMQGKSNFVKYLEANPEITNMLFNKFRETLSKATTE